MDVLLIIDMQCGLLEGEEKQDLAGVIARINLISGAVRASGGAVVWIRHCGRAGEGFERQTPSWEFLPGLTRQPRDIVVEKTFNDAFAGTILDDTLTGLAPSRLLICGWATDFCVDSTVRSAVAHGYPVTVIRDAHTLANRPHLDAPQVKEHHHWLWTNLIAETPVRLLDAQDLLEE